MSGHPARHAPRGAVATDEPARTDVARGPRRAALLALAALPLGLGSSRPAMALDGWPALGDAASGRRHGQWVWQELLTGDPQAAATFYERVFGWTVERRGVGPRAYRLARRDGRPVAGLLRIADGPDGRTPPARWIGLMSVPDVDAAIARVTATGGRLLAGPTAQFGRGTVALLADPDDAPFGVVRASEGDPEDRAARDGEWIWRELWAADGARMAAWYRDLGHFALRRLVGPDDRDEWLLSSGDVARAGVIDKPATVRHAAWLPYLRVADLDLSLRAVGDAGGRVLAAPSPTWRAGRVAIVADPQGAAVGLALAPAEGAQ